MNRNEPTEGCPVARPWRSRIDESSFRQALARTARNGADPLLDECGRMLVERLREIHLAPSRVLDLGCRSATVAAGVRHRWRRVGIVQMGWEPISARRMRLGRQWLRPGAGLVTGDPRRLPFREGSFEMVVANLAWHWCQDPLLALREARRVCRPEGALLFVVMGDHALRELRESCEAVDRRLGRRVSSRVIPLASLSQWGEWMQGSGWRQSVVDREATRVYFPSLKAMVARLGRFGAGNHQRPRAGWSGRDYFREVEAHYREQYGTATGQLPVTLELVFGHGWRGDGVAATGSTRPVPTAAPPGRPE